MNKIAVTCPISEEKADENVARVVAFFTILIASVGIYFKSPIVIGGLAIDFYLRAFTTGTYSPLKYISRKTSHYLRLPIKTTDAAPKKFAAAMGLIFTVSISGLLYFRHGLPAELASAVLLLCAGLESFKGFCVGCIVYTYVILPFLSKENSEQSTISINL